MAVVVPMAVCFGLGSWVLSGMTGPTTADRALAPALPVHYGSMQRVFEVVARLGAPASVAAASGLVALLCLLLRHRRAAVLCLVGPPLAGAVAEWVLKPLIDRRMDGELAFPSGQASGAVAVAVVIAILLLPGAAFQRQLGRVAKTLLWIVAAAFGAGVGLALVALHLHYTTDVLGAMALAPVVIVALAAGLDRLGGRVGVRRPARSAGDPGPHAGEACGDRPLRPRSTG